MCSKLPPSTVVRPTPAGPGEPADRQTRCPLPGSSGLTGQPQACTCTSQGASSSARGEGRQRRVGSFSVGKRRGSAFVQWQTPSPGGCRQRWAQAHVGTTDQLHSFLPTRCCCHHHPCFLRREVPALSSKIPLSPHGTESGAHHSMKHGYTTVGPCVPFWGPPRPIP